MELEAQYFTNLWRRQAKRAVYKGKIKFLNENWWNRYVLPFWRYSLRWLWFFSMYNLGVILLHTNAFWLLEM